MRRFGLYSREQLDDQSPVGLESAGREVDGCRDELDVTLAIRDLHSRQLGRHVRQYDVHTITNRLPHALQGRYVADVGDDRRYVLQPQGLDGLQVDTDHTAGATHSRRGNLQPAARPAAQVDHARAGTEQALTLVELLELDRGSRTVAGLLGRNIDSIFSYVGAHGTDILPDALACGSIRSRIMALNPRQLEAVSHDDGPLLILAGAGSGKTRVLVHRIARLIAEHRASPHEILAVTFTNKAARELIQRCENQIGPRARDVWAGTFHGIGARLLRRHAAVLGYPEAFSIFDADDQLRIIKELVAEADIDETVVVPEAVRAYIESQKNEAVLPDRAGTRRTDYFGKTAADLYRKYQLRLRRLGAMDFGDLIVSLVELLRTDADLLARYQRRFRYVFVDEYQDTNHAQYLMVSMLAAGHGNLCVVGDDDQSIYGWRGADLRNILEFERDFPGARSIHLDQNYRSTANIIEAAHALISHNKARMDKRMWTANPPGAPIRLYKAGDERDEARYVVDSLRELGHERGRAAVFYRTNAQSRAIEEALIHAGMPYVIVGGTRFYERREIKDLIAYLRFVHNTGDDLALARIINVPARGIGRVTWDRLRSDDQATAGSVWQALEGGGAKRLLSGAPRSRVERFVEIVQPWLSRNDEERVTPLLQRIIEDTGYVEYLENLPGEDGHGRVENVRELLTVSQNFDLAYDAREFDEDEPRLSALAAFLEQLTLAAEVDSYDGTERAVTLMTAHNSKGLEFPYVFMTGMEEGIFPHGRSISDESDTGIEEERRLCYVAMTRAQQQLTMLYAEKRHVFGTTQFNFPSRFLEEIPTEHVREDFASGAAEARRESYEADFHESETEQVRALDPSTYRVGMKVVHPMFGVGTVRKCDQSGKDEKLVVHFQRAGIKKLVARYARLEIV